jgi:hypothetical protein
MNALEEYAAVTFRVEVCMAKMWLQYADRLHTAPEQVFNNTDINTGFNQFLNTFLTSICIFPIDKKM